MCREGHSITYCACGCSDVDKVSNASKCTANSTSTVVSSSVSQPIQQAHNPFQPDNTQTPPNASVLSSSDNSLPRKRSAAAPMCEYKSTHCTLDGKYLGYSQHVTEKWSSMSNNTVLDKFSHIERTYNVTRMYPRACRLI